MMAIQNSILVVDGLNVFMRHFAVSEAVNAGGQLVGGATGFIKAIGAATELLKPEKLFVVWEQGGPSQRRKHIFPGYKANRSTNKKINEMYRKDGKYKASSDEGNKIFQLSLCAKALSHTPVCQVYVPDTEADDVIAYIVKQKYRSEMLEGKRRTKFVMSSDKDFYQLLEDDTVRIYDPARKIIIDAGWVLENFAAHPRNITLARAVVGDPSDNLDGVDGIGFKTITSRFQDLKRDDVDLDTSWLFEATERAARGLSGRVPKCYESIKSSADIIERNWKLMYLDASSLAANQIAKINYKIDEHDNNKACNRLDYIKVFAAADIPVDAGIDRSFTQLKRLMTLSE